MLAPLALLVPLSLDTFAVAAALGARSPDRAQRWRLTGVLVAFETGMPLLGLALGSRLVAPVGSVAEYLAAVLLVALGLWLLLGSEDAEERAVTRLAGTGPAMLLAGLAVSVDELAIGFTLGLTGAATAIAVAVIAIQALLAAQLGLALGGRIAPAWRERAERLAGVLLVGFGVALAANQLLR